MLFSALISGVCEIKNKPKIRIVSPVAFSTINDEKLDVTVNITAPNGVEKVQFFRDDRSLPYTTERKSPYTGYVRFGSSVPDGKHTIRVKVYDSIGFFDEAVIEVNFVGNPTATTNTPLENRIPTNEALIILPE